MRSLFVYGDQTATITYSPHLVQFESDPAMYHQIQHKLTIHTTQTRIIEHLFEKQNKQKETHTQAKTKTHTIIYSKHEM